MRFFPLVVALVAAALVAPSAIAQNRANDIARFDVTTRVVNPDLQAFSATTFTIGNGDRWSGGGGFEPVKFRNMFLATGGDRRRIDANLQTLSQYNSWKSGAFDGAKVDVLRIEDGAFRLVRSGRIAPGGYNASDWYSGNTKRLIDPEAGSYLHYWDTYNRADVPYYFSLRAVDGRGRMSAFSQAVGASRPGWSKNVKVENPMVKAPRNMREGSRLPAPSDLAAVLTDDGGVRLSWTPVEGAAGYRLYQSDLHPAAMRGSFIELEDEGPEVLGGDLVILRHEFLEALREDLLTNRVWDAREPKRIFPIHRIRDFSDAPGGGNWQLIRHGADSPVPDGGETYLRVAPAKGQTIGVGSPVHSGTGQDFYDVWDPAKDYRIEFWARGTGGASARIVAWGPFGGRKDPAIGPFEVDLRPEWRAYSFPFRVPRLYDGDRPGRIDFAVTGPGQVDLDNFRIIEADRPYLQASDHEVAILRDSGMRFLRTHAWIKSGFDGYDLMQLTNPAGAMNAARGNTLDVMLRFMVQTRTNPWLQIEPHFSVDEWLGLVEYLAAPFDPATDDPSGLPWAAKRHAQGQTDPWIDRFDEVLFEVGNETWNRIFRPWTFPEMTDAVTGKRFSPGAVYGMYQEYVLSILRQSPHWSRLEPKFSAVIGGRTINDYGISAMETSPRSRYLTHTGYIGGWDEGEGPVRPNDASYFSVLTNVLQTDMPRVARRLEQKAQLDRKRQTPLELGTYEAGPGYAMFGPGRERLPYETRLLQEAVMKGAAAGTATLDSFLYRAANGFTLQNFFTFGEGRFWTSYAPWYRGGHTFPAWDLLSLVNTEALGDVLAVETLDAPVTDLPALRRREAVHDGPLVAAYATRSGTRLSVILVSRRVPGVLEEGDTGVTDVRLKLPIIAADQLTRVDQTGDYRSHNHQSKEVQLVQSDMDLPDDFQDVVLKGLPPGESVFLFFDGVTWAD